MKKSFFVKKLLEAGGKVSRKNLDSIEFCAPDLLIKHVPTGVEYTVLKVKIDNNVPYLYAYRYDTDNPDHGRVFVKVTEKQWSGKNPEYSRV